jgi:predicted nucleic-acid-binding Zn-ribbon protein
MVPIYARNMTGLWGTPATDEDICPKCGSKSIHYIAGFAACAENKCDECGYSELFLY